MARSALFLAALAGCEAYVPPPSVASTNLDHDLYDPAQGPLQLGFSDAVDPETLKFALRVSRTDREGEPCLAGEGGALPAGCTTPSTVVVGPCTPDFAKAERIEDSQDLRFPCGDGGSFVFAADHRSLRIESDTRLIPYERYVVEFDTGLATDTGADIGSPLRVGFQVKGDLPLAPTDFESGMFFSVFDVEEPIAAQFQFYFWFEVNHDTGEVKFFGADIDPKDASYDPKVDRDPAHWVVDPNPPKGVTLSSKGQIAENPDGRVLVVYPFLLSVAIPKVEARGVEVNARWEHREMEGAPPGERDIATGSMFAPVVILGATGEPANLGSGRGRVTFFRLLPEEAPPLSALVPTGRTVEDLFK